jgi:hypothetical protein
LLFLDHVTPVTVSELLGTLTRRRARDYLHGHSQILPAGGYLQ